MPIILSKLDFSDYYRLKQNNYNETIYRYRARNKSQPITRMVGVISLLTTPTAGPSDCLKTYPFC